MTGEIIALAKFAFNSNNPAVSISVVMVVAFLLFVTAKKFFTTEFLKTSKEARDTQHQLNDELRAEVERLNKKIEELTAENIGLKQNVPGD